MIKFNLELTYNEDNIEFYAIRMKSITWNVYIVINVHIYFVLSAVGEDIGRVVNTIHHVIASFMLIMFKMYAWQMSDFPLRPTFNTVVLVVALHLERRLL